VPDFAAELLSSADGNAIEYGEWRWYGHYTDGTVFDMRGVTVLGVESDRIVWGRLYMEPVDADVDTIDDMVERTYKAPPQSS
jgi:hypothetical protein